VTQINARIKVLHELVRGSHYVVDPEVVAHAIVLRSMTRRAVPDVIFRSMAKVAEVRSFRPHRGARSFRLSARERRGTHRLAAALDS
jgi:hypothetical protein